MNQNIGLPETLHLVRGRITKHRNDRSFNEQTTKASLIVPVLQALGWDTSDSDEVHWEYKPRPKYNPVDFALMLQRTPCMFVEAKALRETLGNDKLAAQIITYAGVAGVEWVVLTNGDEYCIYNASAPVPIEEKLFRRVAVSRDDEGVIIATLSLLSKTNLQDKKIGRLWASHFVDRKVEIALRELLNPDEPSRALVSAIRRLTGEKIRVGEIRASLRRARVQIDFPVEPDRIAEEARATRPERKSGEPGRGPKRSKEPIHIGVSLADLIAERVLRPPVEVFVRYRGQQLTATIEADGSVVHQGKRYDSLSTAGGMARKPFHKGDLQGRPYPQTNGWTFWQILDPEGGKAVAIGELRQRLLDRKKAEADRFRRA